MANSRFFAPVKVLSYCFIFFFDFHVYGQNWKAQYDRTWSEDTIYTIVRKNNRSGLAETKTGKLVIPVKYAFVDRITDSIYRIADERHRGYINPKGDWLVPLQYDLLWFERPDRAIVQKNGLLGVVDFKGNVIIPIRYLRLDRISQSGFIAQIDLYCGVIDRNGKTLIPFKYENILTDEEGTIPAKLGGKWGLIDWKDNVVIPFQWEYIDSFMDDMAIVSGPAKDGKSRFGFINRKNQLVIGFQYDLAYNFRNGRAEVMLNGKWVYIDKTGKVMGPSR